MGGNYSLVFIVFYYNFILTACEPKKTVQESGNRVLSEADSTKTGKWVTLNQNGDTASVINYVNGVMEGNAKYFENGNLKIEAIYKEGKFHGSYTEYHPNGVVDAMGEFWNGEQHGFWKIFDERGILKREFEMNEGRPFGKFRTYFANGSVEFEGSYVNGSAGKLYNNQGDIIGEFLLEEGIIIDTVFMK